MQVNNLKYYQTPNKKRVYSRQRMSIPAKRLNGNLAEAQKLLRDNPVRAIEYLTRFLDLGGTLSHNKSCAFDSHANTQSLITGVPHIVQPDNKIKVLSINLDMKPGTANGTIPQFYPKCLVADTSDFKQGKEISSQCKQASNDYKQTYEVQETLAFNSLAGILNKLKQSPIGTIAILSSLMKQEKLFGIIPIGQESGHMNTLVKWDKNRIFLIDRAKYQSNLVLPVSLSITPKKQKCFKHFQPDTFYLSTLAKTVSPKLLKY